MIQNIVGLFSWAYFILDLKNNDLPPEKITFCS